jgi:hexosaminidase
MISIIPKPHHMQLHPGEMQLSTPISVTGINGAHSWLERIPGSFGDHLLSVPNASDAQLLLDLNPDLSYEVGAEGYQLTITPKQVTISAAESAGLYYGMQTFQQLLPPDPLQETTLPCITIMDQPRFEWRGFMLDEARHFFGMETVKRILDWLTFFKINRFHWHLTDYQGWRVEIEK